MKTTSIRQPKQYAYIHANVYYNYISGKNSTNQTRYSK